MRSRVSTSAALLSLLAAALAAQVRPVYDRGAAGLVDVLERLQTTSA